MRLQQQPNLVEATDAVPASSQTAAVRALRREYSITPQEADRTSGGRAVESNQDGLLQKAAGLVAQLTEAVDCEQALMQPNLKAHQPVVNLLLAKVHHKQALIVRALLENLTPLQNQPDALAIARSAQQLAPQLLSEYLSQHPQPHLHPDLAQIFRSAASAGAASQPSGQPFGQDSLGHLENLLQSGSPLAQAATLYLLAQLDVDRTQTAARRLKPSQPLLQETVTQVLAQPAPPTLIQLPALEKLVCLYNSDLFQHVHTETLMALGERAEVRIYKAGEPITEAGDTCRELLLLLEGSASIHYLSGDQIQTEQLQPGQMLDELEVLTHSSSENTILAETEKTRILAISVDTLDDLLEHDSDFARRILELESRRLQQLVRAGRTGVSMGPS